MAPTTEPAMVPGDAAPLEEPDAASLEGPFVVGGAFVGRGAIEGGTVGRGAGAGAADVLEEMDPDDAADLLREVGQEREISKRASL